MTVFVYWNEEKKIGDDDEEVGSHHAFGFLPFWLLYTHTLVYYPW